MAIVTLGAAVRGVIDHPDGSCDATEFFCMSELPLFPLKGLHIVAGRKQNTPFRGASIALAYGKGWGWLAVTSLAVFAFVSSPTESLASAVIIAGAAVALLAFYLWSCWSLGRRRASRQATTAGLLLVVPGAVLGFGLWLALQDHVELQVRRCLAGKLDQCSEAARKYQNGIDVRRDPKRAGELYGRACQGGDRLACGHRAR